MPAVKKTYLLLVVTAVFWGANPLAVKVLLTEWPPMAIVFFRFLGISALLMGVLFYSAGRRALPKKKHLFGLVMMGLMGIALNNGMQFTGLQYSTVVNCTLISALNPSLTTLMATLFLGEQATRRQWTGILLSLLGVIFLVAHGSLDVILHLSLNQGDLLYLGSQFAWSLYSIIGRKVLADMTPTAATAWAGLFGAGFVGLYLLIWEGRVPASMSMAGGAAMIYMILGSGILAFNWWNAGVAAVGPSRTAIFTNVIPLAGMALAVVFLGEHVGWQELVGGLWICFGVYLTTRTEGGGRSPKPVIRTREV